MTLTLPTLAPAQERAIGRGWSRAGLAWFLRDKARTLGGMADHRTGWFRYWRWEDADEGLRGEILDRLDKGEWDHLKDVCKAPGVPGHGTAPETKGTDVKLEETYGTGKFIKATTDGRIGLPGTTDFPETFVGTIKKIGGAEFDDGSKQRVIYFEELPQENGKDKGLGLNVTNWRTIAQYTGKNDDDQWVGERVSLFVVPEAKAESGFSIRVKKPGAAPTQAAPASPALGAEWAKAMVEKVKAQAAESGDGCNAGALRSYLAGRFPDLAAVLTGPPNLWPKTVEGEVDSWLLGQQIPF